MMTKLGSNFSFGPRLVLQTITVGGSIRDSWGQGPFGSYLYGTVAGRERLPNTLQEAWVQCVAILGHQAIKVLFSKHDEATLDDFSFIYSFCQAGRH